MLYLSVTQSSVITTTLRELSLCDESYYTWKLISRNTFDEYYMSPDDISTSLYYNSFMVSVGTPISLTGSNVRLNLGYGEYHYYVYEMENQYDLDINNSCGMVETGILFVNGTSSTIQSYTQSDDNTLVVYRNL